MRAAQHDHGHEAVPSDLTLRVKTLESLLVEKGLVDPAALDALINTYEHKVGPRNGARVVARAWVDPAPFTPRARSSFAPASLESCSRSRRRTEVCS
jgi:Nitrile hydratase, alpha chain